MTNSDNIFFRILDIFAHFVLLNALWIICCIPIVTIFPATTALFGVVRKWHTDGTEAGAFGLFFSLFHRNFKKSFLIGLLWMIAGVILYVDAALILQMEFTGKIFVWILVIFSSILYLFMTIYIFFVLVHYELSILQTIKNALFLSIGFYLHTILFLFVIASSFVITYFAPIFLLILGSVLAFTMYHIFRKLSNKIDQKGIINKSVLST